MFISIPMKWMQLYELIRARGRRRGGVRRASSTQATRELTGGALRWGLSAAGYLDPEIFRFFQRQRRRADERLRHDRGDRRHHHDPARATTATTPSASPLPGIEVALADDGELMIRGPYVMMGYLDPPDGEPSFDADGWFHTGDLMERDGDGHFRIVDRKKEIYKNIKGQTDRAAEDREPVPRLRVGGQDLPGRATTAPTTPP